MSFYRFTLFSPITGAIPEHDFGLTKQFASHARCFLGFNNRDDATIHSLAELMEHHLSQVDEPLIIGRQNTRFRQLIYLSKEIVDKHTSPHQAIKEYELYATLQLLQVHELVMTLGDESYDKFFSDGTMAHVLPEFIARMSELTFIMQKLHIGEISAQFASKATESAMILTKRIQAQRGASKKHEKDKEAKEFLISKYWDISKLEKWEKSASQAARDLQTRYPEELQGYEDRTIYEWLRAAIKAGEPQ